MYVFVDSPYHRVVLVLLCPRARGYRGCARVRREVGRLLSRRLYRHRLARRVARRRAVVTDVDVDGPSWIPASPLVAFPYRPRNSVWQVEVVRGIRLYRYVRWHRYRLAPLPLCPYPVSTWRRSGRAFARWLGWCFHRLVLGSSWVYGARRRPRRRWRSRAMVASLHHVCVVVGLVYAIARS